MLSKQLAQWEASGEYLQTQLFGHRVYARQLGDANAVPEQTLLLLHGFPESSYSFHKVIDGLAAGMSRVVVFDMLGYGLSDKPTENYAYSLVEQADVALQVWRHLGVRGGHLLGHDMGDSVATELLTRHVAGAMPAWFDGLQELHLYQWQHGAGSGRPADYPETAAVRRRAADEQAVQPPHLRPAGTQRQRQ